MARQWWAGLNRRQRVYTVLLAVFAIGLAGHQLALVNWYVEDAAISFAFARNLINGEGLVAYPGGERVEGYSNPTWVAVLALMQLLWLDPFWAVKVVQVFLALATLPPVYLAMREAVGKESDAPLIACAFVAANAQFAIWGAAGLENALLHLLMALAIWRMMVEHRVGGVPWSSLLWLLVALSRPEALMYAAVGGAWAMLISWWSRRTFLPTLQWLALFFVPWSAYQAVHLWYFAWPLPNTYYGKLGTREFVHWVWDDKAWNWSRNFFHQLAQGYFLPIWLLGVIGDGWRRVLVASAVFVLLGPWLQLAGSQRWLLATLVGVLWITFWIGLRFTEDKPQRGLMIGATVGGLALIGISELVRYAFSHTPEPIVLPEAVENVLPFLLPALAVLLPIAGFGARGWQLRGLVWLLCCASTFFAIYVQWDWMKGFRWYAPAVVPGSLLFAFGVDSFVQLVEQMFAREPVREFSFRRYTPFGIGVAVLLVLLQVIPNVVHTVGVAMKPDTSPRGVLPRVKHVQGLRTRLHIDERLVDLDVDQGAHLWWSDFVMMDMAGLIDVPFAHQHYERAFLQEYMFQEMRPHYAHVHGSWATTTKIPSVPEWRKQYVEVPGYAAGQNEHVGSFVRRDLIVTEAWPHGDARRVVLDEGLVVHGLRVPSAPAAERKMYVEVGIASTNPRKKPSDNFRMVLFATEDGKLTASWDAPPGYDWLLPRVWSSTEVFVGKFDLSLPKSMAPGRYDLGLVVFDADGAVIGAALGDARSVGPEVRIGGEEGTTLAFAPGEVHFPGVLEILDPVARDEAAQQRVDQSLARASAGNCEEAEQMWWLARKHRPVDTAWATEHRPPIARAIADCWARSADEPSADRAQRVVRLVRAHDWDHWSSEYRVRAEKLADELYEEGLAAREAKDWETAYRAFADTAAVDRTRSWARRYAEEARAFRLGIDAESLKKREAEELAKRKAAQDRKAERAKEAEAKKAAAEQEAKGEGEDGGGQ